MVKTICCPKDSEYEFELEDEYDRGTIGSKEK
jgi:hypothetical protein